MDRKHPYLEYTIENTVPCCYWCNNAKTDEFCEKEFLKIAENITFVWNNRIRKLITLNKLTDNDVINPERIDTIRTEINKLFKK